MKIVIFGAGNYYQRRKQHIPSDMEIIAFLDNNFQLQGKKIDGVQVLEPYKIKQVPYDKVVLMSNSITEMREQLIKLNVSEENIWSWEQLNSEIWHGIFRFYAGDTQIREGKKRVLIISTELNYNGGTFAAVYAASALRNKGFNVMLAAQDGNAKLINEIIEDGINVIICHGLPYLKEEELFFIKQFDVVIVNVFQMISCACEISKIRPTMWWIHEPSEMYKNTMMHFPQYTDKVKLKKISIYAVSSIAQRNFNHYFPERIKKTLSYGIPNQRKESIPDKESIVFAIIGCVCLIKAQDIFIRAAKLLNDEDRKNVQFWIIGSIGNDKYSRNVRELIGEDTAFRVYGEVTRGRMQELYKEIDVVVCVSIEDCLPMVITEGMMLQKVCIISNHTGSVDYIEDSINGFIVPAGDVFALKEKMKWCIHNKKKRKIIGKKAREAYEENFAMDIFGDKLEKALIETEVGWNYK